MTIVFETPGLIDIRAFTLMGVSAKPGSANPIGLFGTGLKYAMAVLVRLGARPVVLIGQDRYTFEKRPASFRGVDYEALRMRVEKFSWTRGRYTDLPYTTGYGRFWKPWMAFRELEANTRDENGRTYQSEARPEAISGAIGLTNILIDLPEFTKAWAERNTIFLPDADRGHAHGAVQVIDEPGKTIYWRGLRVYQTGKSGLHTYNFLGHMDLTEDRTITTEWWPRYVLARWVATECEDEALIEEIVSADDGTWEHGLEPPDDTAPSAAFHRVMMRRPKYVGGGWGTYYARHDERVTPQTFDPFRKHPVPWEVQGNAVVDAYGETVFDRPAGYADKWEITAAAILRRANLGAGEDLEVMSNDEQRLEPAPTDEVID